MCTRLPDVYISLSPVLISFSVAVAKLLGKGNQDQMLSKAAAFADEGTLEYRLFFLHECGSSEEEASVVMFCPQDTFPTIPV